MRAFMIQNLERHLPQLLIVAQILVGRERGSDEILEDWVSTVLESKAAADFASLSAAHLFASCCVYFLMSKASLEISDIDNRVEIAVSEITKITLEGDQYIRQLLLPARETLKYKSN